MRQFIEKRVELGFDRPAKQVFDEIESISAQMIREGWNIDDSLIDSTMGYVDLFFYRDLNPKG